MPSQHHHQSILIFFSFFLYFIAIFHPEKHCFQYLEVCTATWSRVLAGCVPHGAHALAVECSDGDALMWQGVGSTLTCSGCQNLMWGSYSEREHQETFGHPTMTSRAKKVIPRSTIIPKGGSLALINSGR